MTTTYTQFLRLPKTDFRTSPWHQSWWTALDHIDSTIYNALILLDLDNWDNGIPYRIGNVAIDTDGVSWVCVVEHTSAAAGTFLADRTANPTYWEGVSLGLRTRGSWANLTDYKRDDIVYDQSLSILAICITAHTSKASPNDITDDAVKWTYIFDGSGGGGGVAASGVTYDHATSGLAAIQVQAALDEIVALTGAALALRAPILTPVFTGSPQGTTAPAANNSTRLATTAFVQGELTTLKGGVSGSYDTLGKIATAIALLAPLASPALTGNPTAPTPSPGDSDTTIATTGFVAAAIATIGAGFASGTRILFQQTAAPTGWTKDTTQNDKALRVISGTVGTGGNIDFSTVFAKQTTDGVTLGSGNLPSFTLAVPVDASGLNPAGGPVGLGSTGGTTGNLNVNFTGSATPFTAGMDIRVKYVDVIIAQKD